MMQGMDVLGLKRCNPRQSLGMIAVDTHSRCDGCKDAQVRIEGQDEAPNPFTQENPAKVPRSTIHAYK
ncbi:hypothetical protein Tco_0572659 [Tanacetum coccineum]|uniref:Uncharacterized protein n=1 Tax=Tanacetum coccineum TaxID=301880 RepID=A0ABQ4X8Y8_9ASTR